MSSILVVGADSIPGQAVSRQLSRSHNLTGLTLGPSPRGCVAVAERVTKSRLKTALVGTDVIVFAGDASRSSWDPDFGTFSAEEQWLAPCVEAAQKFGSKLIMISTDAVFTGPWIFHSDECRNTATSNTARHLLSLEDTVAGVPNALIVRTNVLGCIRTSRGFCSQVMDAQQKKQEQHLDASNSSTPLASAAFAAAFAGLLKTDANGYVNIGGAERTTPYHFALMLAAGAGHDAELIHAVVEPQPGERSMLCERLRHEFGVAPPMLRETVEALQFADHENASAVAA